MKRRRPARNASALAVAIERNDWEFAALLLLDAFASVARRLPPGAIDDALALIAEPEVRDDTTR